MQKKPGYSTAHIVTDAFEHRAMGQKDMPAAIGWQLLATVDGAMLSIVPHVAAVKRSFSGHWRVPSKTRARLHVEHLCDKMMIR